MISAHLRRVRRQRRAVARAPLAELLHAAFWHAVQPLAGRRLTADTLAEAERATARAITGLADRGVFRYFGIADAVDLGPLEVTLLPVGTDGEVMLEADSLVAQILGGGRRGEGWTRPGALTVDDLAR